MTAISSNKQVGRVKVILNFTILFLPAHFLEAHQTAIYVVWHNYLDHYNFGSINIALYLHKLYLMMIYLHISSFLEKPK